MPPSYKQLELDLWGDLKTALKEPESADMELLWQGLEDAIANQDSNEQLLVAGDAISQIVEVFVLRAKGILDGLEITDNSEGPVLGDDFLSGLIRQSMSMDLSDLMEDLTFERVESSPGSGSVVSVIDRKEARKIARKARAAMRKTLKELAEKENIPKWQQAISCWIEQHQEQKVSLEQLQQALGMPLVEVWLGLLHSPTSYQWDGQGEFYRDARDFWIGN
ncbi:hypothetical protein [Synechocystis sp. PCC 7509]|uniref:hypothetical protein n=1 Tax=Synechocystis sp. PCC 7509 TaxID=927677 RepID=UPI0002AD1092|nr:hypothetical protein [Synechocystis sp. PCC 7509]